MSDTASTPLKISLGRSSTTTPDAIGEVSTEFSNRDPATPKKVNKLNPLQTYAIYTKIKPLDLSPLCRGH